MPRQITASNHPSNSYPASLLQAPLLTSSPTNAISPAITSLQTTCTSLDHNYAIQSWEFGGKYPMILSKIQMCVTLFKTNKSNPKNYLLRKIYKISF